MRKEERDYWYTPPSVFYRGKPQSNKCRSFVSAVEMERKEFNEQRKIRRKGKR